MPLTLLHSDSARNIADSAEKRLMATSDRFFRRFIHAWLALGGVIWLLEFLLTPAVQYPGLIMMATGLVSMGLMRWGKPVAARWGFIGPLCVVAVAVPFFVNGVRTPLLFNMPLLIVLAGWLLGRKTAALISAVFSLAVVGYWAAEASGWYVPPQPLRSPDVWGVSLPPILVLMGVTIWSLLSSYTAQLAKEIELQRELDQALAEIRLAYDGLDTVSSHIFAKDLEGRYRYANKAVCELFGRPLAEIVGQRDEAFFDLQRSNDLRQIDQQVLASGKRLEQEERNYIATTGEVRYYWTVKSPMRDAQHRIVGLFGISTDITEKKRIEESLREAQLATTAANAQLASVLRFSQDVMLNSPLPMGVYAADGQCVQVNDAYADLAGVPRAVLEAQNFHRVAAFQKSGLLDSCLRALAENRAQRHEANAVSSTGKSIFCEYRVLPTLLNGQPHLLVQLIDLSERKRMEEELRRLAFHDALTQLPNRRLLLDRLLHALRVRQRSDLQLAVLFLDLNRFKQLNDTHGHDAGDLLLIEVARRLQQHVRASDTVARLGGDEFVVLLEMPDVSPAHAAAYATAVAEKIRVALSEDYVLGDIRHQGSASVGIKLVGPQDLDPDQILKDADAAMYEVKRRR